MKICVAFGTRPEAIKLAPVIRRLQQVRDVEVRVLVSGQHRSLLDQALELFGIRADINLNVMRTNQNLGGLTARILNDVERDLLSYPPDWMLVQGDTTTAFAAAMAAYYHRIAIAHVEAGLRTDDRFNPFPEEINRKFIASLADLHFAPTQRARENLLREGINPAAIHVTGNTGIDALLQIASRRSADCFNLPAEKTERIVLVTSHRRESFGRELANVCSALRNLVKRNSEIRVVYAMHPNPNVSTTVRRELHGLARIELIEAPDYAGFVNMMKRSFLILTDSGGIQEEAPSLGKPVLVLRARTERVEAIEAGTARLVGTDPQKIVSETERLLYDPILYARMAQAGNPYGDGLASERVVHILLSARFERNSLGTSVASHVIERPEPKLHMHA